MSFSKSRLFQPSYIWKNRKEITEKKGILSRILGLKSDEKSGKNKSHGKYQELNESSEDAEKKTFESILKIISSKNGKFSVNWQNENEKIKLLEISEHEMSTVFFETLQKSNFCIGELFLCLEKGNSGFLMTRELPQISVGKLYMRMETFEMVEWWLRRISSIDLTDLSISPFGDHPINLPAELFEMPHFCNCRSLCLMEHCLFSSAQFLSICSAVPHFSFYSDNISESVVKAAVESKMSSVNGDYVLEWFFARRVNTEDVLQEVARPSCERKERFSHQKQCFEPVDVYPVSNENNKKLSLMIVKDPSDHFNPYSLVLFS